MGYPLLVYLVSRIRPSKVKKSDDFEPDSYDYDYGIQRRTAIFAPNSKILCRLITETEKLEILVASDGSTDKTDEIVKEFAARGVKLFRQDGRMGKTFTQNKAVEQATGEIILFSDATTDYEKDVLRVMLPNFADETVGCVAGKLIYVDESKSGVGKGAKSYWNYETFLKESESRACSLIGASGCLYAVRKSAYEPMYAEACSDFLICTILYKQGLRSIYEPRAVCTEETNRQANKEMQMRVRVISQTFTDLWRNREMLNPLRSGFYAVELFSHKVLRYSVPVFLIAAFYFGCAFGSLFFQIVLAVQILFFALLLLCRRGGHLKKTGKIGNLRYTALFRFNESGVFNRILQIPARRALRALGTDSRNQG